MKSLSLYLRLLLLLLRCCDDVIIKKFYGAIYGRLDAQHNAYMHRVV